MGWLALLFTVLPLVDLWLLLVIGDVLGFWPTVGFTIAIAVAGAYLGKREGLRVLRELMQAFAELRTPEEGLVSGALVVAGAALLVTPGVLTDVIGLVLLFPPTRRPLGRVVGRLLKRRMARAMSEGRLRVQVSSFGSVHHAHEDDRVEVVDVEGVRVDEPPQLGPKR